MGHEYETLNGLLHARFSCRAFRPDPVPEGTIRAILRAARRAPSWCNAQPWQVIVASGAALKAFREGLQEAAQTRKPAPDLAWPTGYSGVYQERRREVGWQLYGAVGVEKGDRAGAAKQSARNFALFDAPHVAIVHSPRELGSYGAVDCGGFITAFTLAAQALGVATVPQAAVAGYAPYVRDHFGIGEDRMVICAISFGVADKDHPANSFRAGRADLEEILDFRS